MTNYKPRKGKRLNTGRTHFMRKTNKERMSGVYPRMGSNQYKKKINTYSD